MESVKDRFLRYVKIDTESQHHVDKIPSTDKQLVLCRLLHDELVAIGASDVALDPHGYVTATIPANTTKSAPVVGLLSHV
ncbi:MAG: peptidase T, partial [Eubacteriales bacterium]|nr:peptidase T [Eubacteriales bacterium]